ncbi:uncharacterized protein LOC124809549 [Hydra vulgaris]|uniref:uncharacterized protein LOC124809549 n=1 Tax=Hydra vulgaris TaxID=6087 RepID=UPI001F5F4709|nr:uncharacterized protein LOC124809549 [Hydra vulgaris]
MTKKVKFLIIWPSLTAIRHNMPSQFLNFKKCVVIIDCTDIFIQRPNNLEARAITWSNYKSTNTIKYLIVVSPAEAITFLSHGWGGRISDKEITIKSGFLDFVGYGDSILADREFLIEEELALKCATLHRPSFTKGKKQLSAKEVEESRKLSHLRIHIERVIGRLKSFKILSSVFSITQVDLLNDILISICAIVNLNKSVVS